VTIWTPENTPNGVWLPPAARGNVALFFRFNPPTKLNPGQLLLMENHAGGITRNLDHWGYVGAIASRRQTPEEHNHAAICGRHTACYYQSWPALINDERRILAESPEVGSRFLERLIELSRLREYRLHQLPRGAELPDDEARPDVSLSELTPPEMEVAQQAADRIGITQFPLF
jgi:hypothetical protein